MKLYIKGLIVIITNFVFFIPAFTQTILPEKLFDLKSMTPTSPEAAILGRFGDIPIGFYTGTADISIPLYTIKEAGFELPVMLRYHGSGIKVEDHASCVGLGWSLEPGAAIVKIINGTEDALSGDPLPNSSVSGYAFLRNNSVSGVYFERPAIRTWDCLSIPEGESPPVITSLKLDNGQPDIFQYSFPGYSGRFYIHPETGKPVLLDKKMFIDILLTLDGIIITTLDGNKFFFSDVERALTGAKSGNSGVTYKLTRIELHNGKTINFAYKDGYYNWFTYSETYHSDFPAGLGENIGMVIPSRDYTKHYTKTLFKIMTDKVIVEFNLESREDMYTYNTEGIPGIQKVKSIDIIDAQTERKIKTYTLSYDYFSAGNVGGSFIAMNQDISDACSKRLKLLSVQETSYLFNDQQTVKPPYRFIYDESVQLPLKTSFARDFWGYYNGKNNTKMIPDVSFFYFSEDPDYNTMPSNLIQKINGANRSPDSTKMKAGLLKKIIYPAGGHSEFDYEPHSFNNHVYPDIGRLEAASKTEAISDYNRPGDRRSITFSLPRTQNITFYHLITRGVDQSISFGDLLSASITLTKTVSGNTTVIKKWQMTVNDAADFNGSYQWVESITFPYEADAFYSLTTSLPDALGIQDGYPRVACVSSNFQYYTMPEDYKTSYGGGIRVSAIRDYTSEGKVATGKIIRYTDTNNVSSGKLMSPLKPLYKRQMFGVRKVDEYLAVADVKDVWFLSSESVVPFSDAAAGSIVGYSRVEEEEHAPDGTVKGKHVYYYYNFESESHPNVPDNPNLLNGMINKEEIYDTVSVIPLEETIYNYTRKPTPSPYSGVKLVSVFLGDGPCSFYAMKNPPWGFMNQWQLIFYPLISDWFVLKDKQVKKRYDDCFLATTENCTYNNLGQLIKSETINSEERKITEEFFYPNDVASEEALMLKAKSLYNNLLQQKSSIDSQEVIKIKHTYIKDGVQIVKSKIERSFSGNALLEEIKFEKYGLNKTPLQFSQQGSSVAILWSDDNSVPVAIVRNAEYDHVAYTSFEGNDSGRWTYDRSGINHSMGCTGTSSYVLDGNPVTVQNLSESSVYILSYWTRNSSAHLINGSVKVTRRMTNNGWTLFEHQIEGQNNIIVSGTGVLDELKLYPVGASMKSYNYGLLYDLISETDERGQTRYYEYDGVERLKRVKDQRGSVLKEYDYYYRQ